MNKLDEAGRSTNNTTYYMEVILHREINKKWT